MGIAGSDLPAAHESAAPTMVVQPRRRLQNVMGRDWVLGYLLLLPAIAVLAGLIAYPFLYAIYLSLQNKPIGAPGTFVGFENFVRLWRSPIFYQVIRNTLIVMVAGVGLKFLAGLMLALILNERIKFRELWRALLFFPWTIPIVVAGFSWRWILDDLNGVLNLVLGRLGVIDSYIVWLGDPKLAIWMVVAAVLWGGTPFYTMNFLAGLAAIPNELYEAAKIDGANAIRSFFHITLPGLSDVIIITTLLSAIWTATELQWVFVLTKGGPGHATETFPMMAYSQAIGAKALGMGAAVALSFLPLFLVLIFFLTRRMLQSQE
jgi:multiple sugar transport system permease protein